jgi:hypothetical protein
MPWLHDCPKKLAQNTNLHPVCRFEVAATSKQYRSDVTPRLGGFGTVADAATQCSLRGGFLLLRQLRGHGLWRCCHDSRMSTRWLLIHGIEPITRHSDDLAGL